MKKELGTFLLLVILCIVVAVLNPRFLAGANLQNMARLIGAYGIFSLGLGMVIITGGIDLSVGSVFALLGVLLSMMLARWRSAPSSRWRWGWVGCTASWSRGCACNPSSSRSAGCSSIGGWRASSPT